MSGEAGDNGSVVLRAEGVAKSYGAVRALKGVDFEVRQGKVTVLFGENGAGKSTLMKILAGIERPSAGRLELDGELYDPLSPNDAVDRGISIIHQELNLCANLSVRDNIFIGRELRRYGTVDYATQDRIARDLLDRLEEDTPTNTPVSMLRLGQQQLVEIARALSMETRILIMDEPTSALSATESEVLFRVIRELTTQGVAIVYISHHLEEAIALADYAVVLRDGELVGSEPAANISFDWVVRAMVGRETELVFDRDAPMVGETVLSIRDVEVLSTQHGEGRSAVSGVSLDVRAGEVVCLYGLMGAGRTELLEAVAGRGVVVGGRVLLDGQDITEYSIPDRIHHGIGFVPEDRQIDGLIPQVSIASNLSLPSIYALVRGWFIARQEERERVSSEIRDLQIKTSDEALPPSSLSGGNQQKVVIGKVLMTRPKVLLLDEPSRGIDVGAKAEIFNLIFQKAQEGYAVLYSTSEVAEALSASHRLVVMAKGRIVREFDTAMATREEVLRSSGEAASTTKGSPA